MSCAAGFADNLEAPRRPSECLATLGKDLVAQFRATVGVVALKGELGRNGQPFEERLVRSLAGGAVAEVVH